jgi:hypothetical protein
MTEAVGDDDVSAIASEMFGSDRTDRVNVK